MRITFIVIIIIKTKKMITASAILPGFSNFSDFSGFSGFFKSKGKWAPFGWRWSVHDPETLARVHFRGGAVVLQLVRAGNDSLLVQNLLELGQSVGRCLARGV